jgi:RNA polymerase sigma-70 factor (ECF subfamily)
MISPGTDGSRLERARALDEEALAAIYDDFHPAIYRYVYRQVGDVEAARDLTADVFDRMLRAFSLGGGPERHLSAWLYRTAHNLVVDFYRRRSYRLHEPLEENLADDETDLVETAHIRLQTDRLRAAVSGLSPDQKQVILLKFLEGWSNQEVAKALDKSIGAVKSLQHRALAALQRQMSSAEEGT